MRFTKALQLISWAILFYFAAFIIPPVSSFSMPVKQGIARAGLLSMQQDHRQTRLYLVDILVWLKLKDSRHSEKLTVAPHSQTAESAPEVATSLPASLLPARDTMFSWQEGPLQHAISGSLSRSSEIVFSRSGISPPYLP